MPATLTKKKLTLAQAAEQWERSKRDIESAKPLLEEAAEVLHAHFAKTGRTTYSDRIALVTTPGRLILDQPKVRAFFGAKLKSFQKRTAPSQSLTLLTAPDPDA